ncbi:20285_t:CDS:2, partial [Rhizophagus irregularis]
MSSIDEINENGLYNIVNESHSNIDETSSNASSIGLRAVLDCFDLDNDEKGEIREKAGGKSTSLVNTFIDGMSEFEKLSFHEFIAEFGEPLIKLNPNEIAENYKTGEGIFKNIKNLFYR